MSFLLSVAPTAFIMCLLSTNRPQSLQDTLGSKLLKLFDTFELYQINRKLNREADKLEIYHLINLIKKLVVK